VHWGGIRFECHDLPASIDRFGLARFFIMI
jgi:hypothetical protein